MAGAVSGRSVGRVARRRRAGGRRGPARGAAVAAAGASLPPGHQNSKWPTGVPPVMGEHLMPSGLTAPISRSTGPGTGIKHLFSYPTDAGAAVQVEVHADKAGVAAALVSCVEAAASKAVAAKGTFALAIPGGSTIELLAGLAASKVDWANTHVFFVDERCVALDSADSNYKGAMDGFLSKVSIPAENVHTISGTAPAAAEAATYEAQIKSCPALPMGPTGFPAFDLIVLGMGPDAHVASLFPNHFALSHETGYVVPVTDSPKPPAARITFTMPMLNAAEAVVFPMSGKGKAEVVERVLEMQSLPGALPAQLVRPAGGVTWIVDKDAASDLRSGEWADPAKWPRSEVPKPAKATPAAK